MKSSTILLIIAATFSLQPALVKAQQGVSINTDGAPADSKAILDVQSTNKGFLLPRLTAVQRSAMAASLAHAQTGMQVADSASGQLYFWTGTRWTNATTLTGKLPVKVNASTNIISLNAGTQAGDLITWDSMNWVSKQPAPLFSDTLDNMQPFLAVNYFIAAFGVYPTPSDSQPFVGQVCIMGFNYTPVGFLPCDGSLLATIDYPVLFSLISTTYGGDGVTSFAVPDLRGRAALHFGQGTGTSNYNVGNITGTEKSIIAH